MVITKKKFQLDTKKYKRETEKGIQIYHFKKNQQIIKDDSKRRIKKYEIINNQKTTKWQ